MTSSLLLTASLASLLGAAPALSVKVLSAAGEAVPDPSEKRVRRETAVTLFAAVSAPDLGLVADAPRVVLAKGAAARKARPPASGEGWRVRWFKIEVAQRSLSNTDPTFHWEPIAYRDVPLPDCDDRFRCAADLRATLLGDRGGLGTMAFRVEVALGERRAASPGAEKLFRGGLGPDVARVTVRRDDSYLGYLTELFNTPYIWGSAGDPATVHQAERRIGSDCADFVTYGVRRLGHEVPYTSTWELPKYGRTLYQAPAPGDDGIFRDARSGEAIPVGAKGVRPGDLLLFPRHVGAFVRDAPPLGVLSASDVMIHTCWAEPIEQPIAESDYCRSPLKVLRWKVLDR